MTVTDQPSTTHAAVDAAKRQPRRPMRLQRGVTAGVRDVRRLPADQEAEPYERFEVRPLSPTIGAEIGGLQIAEVVRSGDRALVADLNRALLEWKVVFFRDQDLTGEDQRAFASLWGDLEVHPFLPSGSDDRVVRFEKGEEVFGYENIWHSDVTWKVESPLGAVLRCVEAPPTGGDTLWADMYVAYELLPEDVKARIDGLTAIHDFSATFGQALSPEELAEMQATYPPAEHPVVRTHPETGRKLLFVNEPFTTHIVGMDRTESDELLTYLCNQARVPEHQCRFHWTTGTVAFWDNRCTQHYACSDYWPQRRVMERVSILGDRPY